MTTVVILSSSPICFTKQVKWISLWCSTRQLNHQDITKLQGKTTSIKFNLKPKNPICYNYFNTPAGFTAVQIVYKLVVFYKFGHVFAFQKNLICTQNQH